MGELVLGNVFSWTQGKIETHGIISDPMSMYLANPNQPPIQDSRTMYRTFELVFDLWRHGKGNLAGMAARKGFYVLEYVLTDDHPDLVWHILDTIYDMVDKGHIQLLSMFLDHATILAHRRLPAQQRLRKRSGARILAPSTTPSLGEKRRRLGHANRNTGTAPSLAVRTADLGWANQVTEEQ